MNHVVYYIISMQYWDCHSPSILIQEDRALSYSLRYQHKVYNLWEIIRLLWSPNSSDLNIIKLCQFWMKRHITKHSAITSRVQLKEAQIKCWNKMPQERIQAWIERIILYIRKVIRLESRNKYKEGRLKGQAKNRVHQLANQQSSRCSSEFTGLSSGLIRNVRVVLETETPVVL